MAGVLGSVVVVAWLSFPSVVRSSWFSLNLTLRTSWSFLKLSFSFRPTRSLTNPGGTTVGSVSDALLSSMLSRVRTCAFIVLMKRISTQGVSLALEERFRPYRIREVVTGSDKFGFRGTLRI